MGANLVHAPLAQWAVQRANAVAIRTVGLGGRGDSSDDGGGVDGGDDGVDGRSSVQGCITFAALHSAVQQYAQALDIASAPAVVVVGAAQDAQLQTPIAQRLVQFLGIIASGRCAAVADPAWPHPVRQRVLAALPSTPCQHLVAQPDGAFYIGFTSGSTGMPKAYRRSHQSWVESFRACLHAFGDAAAGCILAPGSDAHSLFLFGMVLGLWTGAGVVVQEKFSPDAALRTLQSGQATCLVVVPSQLLLILALAQQRKLSAVPHTKLIMISGARWSRNHNAALRALFPHARVVEFYGASETSFVAWLDTFETAPPLAVGRPFANVELQIRASAAYPVDADIRADAAPRVGQIFVKSPMLFMDYVGLAKHADHAVDASAAVRDGEWLSVRDIGYLDAQGWLCLVGRENRMLVVSGKNIFPEELEVVLQAHPAIAAASVHGVDDALRGQQVVAIVRLQTSPNDSPPMSAKELAHWCAQYLEAYKTPKRFLVCDPWPQTASAKPDHPALAQALKTFLAAPLSPHPCLSPLL